MDNAAKVALHRAPALAELFDALGGKGALSTLAELLDELPVGVALIEADDPSLPLLYLNSQARSLVLAESEGSEVLVGQPLGEVVSEAGVLQAVHEAHEQSGRRRLRYHPQAGVTCDFEAVGLRSGRRTGRRVLATWSDVSSQSSDGRAAGQPGRRPDIDGSGRVDATRLQAAPDARMEVGAELDPASVYDRVQKSARRLQAGVDVALEVAARLEPEAVVERILHRALEAVDAERAMLGRMGIGVQCTILGCVDRMDEPAPVGLTVPLDAQEPALQAIASRRPAQGLIDYEEIGLRALRWSLVIPLVVGGELIALLAVGRDQPQFDDEEVAVLQQIGAIAALAFRNATLFQSLRDATRVRSQFLNMAAHELRTPLSVIAGYVSMLEDGTLGRPPAAWEAPLSVLVDKTRELAHLIDDILLAGRLESGVARASGHSMDISEALRDAARRAGPRGALLGADLQVRIPASAARVWADPDHVGRILDNLVNNAFNYSPAPPRVSITLELDAGSAVVRVEDGGRGIAPDQRDRIFQQFYRVEDQAKGYPPGTGLGLFISRALAERYSGRLELEWSEPGAGSRFALRLPLDSAA